MKRGIIYIKYEEEILYSEGSEALEQRSCECPIPGRIQARLNGTLSNLMLLKVSPSITEL